MNKRMKYIYLSLFLILAVFSFGQTSETGTVVVSDIALSDVHVGDDGSVVWVEEGGLYIPTDDPENPNNFHTRTSSSNLQYGKIMSNGGLIFFEARYQGSDWDVFVYNGSSVSEISKNNDDDILLANTGVIGVWRNSAGLYASNGGSAIPVYTNSGQYIFIGANEGFAAWISRSSSFSDWNVYGWKLNDNGSTVTSQLTLNAIDDSIVDVLPGSVIFKNDNYFGLSAIGNIDGQRNMQKLAFFSDAQYRYIGNQNGRVWFQARNGYSDDWDIYVWNSGALSNVTNNEVDDFGVQCTADGVVYRSEGSIYFCNDSSSPDVIESSSNSVVHFSGESDALVWSSRTDSSSPWMVNWLKNGSSGNPISSGSVDSFPLYGGNYTVVWQDNNNLFYIKDNKANAITLQNGNTQQVFFDAANWNVYTASRTSIDTTWDIMLSSVDTVKPSITVYANGNTPTSDWISSDGLTVTVYAIDMTSGVNEATWLISDEDDIEIHGDSVAFSLPYNGELTFSVSDNAGNNRVHTQIIRFDYDKPLLSLRNDTPSVIPWTNGKATIYFETNDNSSKYPGNSPIDNDNWIVDVDNTGTFSATNKVEGNEYSVTASENTILDKIYAFKVADEAGNYSEPVSVKVQIDKVAPTIEIVRNFTNDSSKSQNFFLPGSSFDPDTEFNIKDQIDGSKINASTLKYKDKEHDSWETIGSDVIILPEDIEGQYEIQLNVYDTAGNFIQNPIPYYYTTIDTKAPTFDKQPDLSGWITSKDLVFEAKDNGKGVNEDSWQWKYSNTDEWHDFTKGTIGQGGTYYYINLPDGEHNIDVAVEDKNGNRGFLEDLYVKVDNGAPIVNVETEYKDEIYNGFTKGQILLYPTIDDDSGFDSDNYEFFYTISTDGISGVQQKSWHIGSIIDVDVNIGETKKGIYTYQFFAIDQAGNIGKSSEISIKIDREEPVITINIITNDVSPEKATEKDVELEYILSDNNGCGLNDSTIEFLLNGETWDPTDTLSEHGKYVFEINASDNLGNANSKSIEIHIDKHGPQVSVDSVDTFCKIINDKLYIDYDGLSAVEPEDGFSAGMPDEVASWSYCIDNPKGDYKALTSASGTIEIDDTLPQGEHLLYFKTEDELGNEGISEGQLFFVDKTDPVVNEITISANADTIIGVNDYLSNTSAAISINATDTFEHEGSFKDGIVYGFYYTLYNSYQSNPLYEEDSFTEGIATDGNVLTGFEPGANYLYVWPVDAAGNIGSYTERIILYDSGKPQAPGISSSTHEEASSVTQASRKSNVSFDISVNGQVPSGVTGYSYRLYRTGEEDPFINGSINATGLSTVEFEGLADNAEGAYYIFSAAVLAGNGKTGTYGEYQFRIDTSPPENLLIEADPHGNSSYIYKQTNTTLEWIKPIDMTGVKQYYYYLTTSEVQLPESDEDSLVVDMSSWNETTDELLNIDLSSVDGVTVNENGDFSEIINAYVCAEDYAGNREYASKEIHVDSIVPWMDTISADEYMEFSPDFDERTVTITHGDVHDNYSADENVYSEVQLSIKNDNGTYTVIRNYSLSDGNAKFYDGLDPEAEYLAEIRVRDEAQNVIVYPKAFRLDGEEVVITTLPFSKDFLGYSVSGVRALAGGVSSGALSVSQKLHMVEYIDSNIVDGPFVFDTLTFDNSTGEFVSGTFAEERVFGLTVHGFEVTGTGASFSSISGISFENMTFAGRAYDALVDEDVYYSVVMEGFSAGFDSLFLCSTVPFTAHDSSFVFRSATSEELPGFVLSTPDSSGLSGNFYTLRNSEWNTEDMYEAYQIDLYSLTEDDQTKQRIITVENTNTNSDFVIEKGDLALPVYLESQDALMKIEQGWIEDDQLIVADARLILPEGFSPREAMVRNFSINLDGEFEKFIDYYGEGFEYVDSNGNTYEFNSIDVTSDGAFLGNTGIVTVANANTDTYAVDSMHLGQEGPVFDNPVSVSDTVNFELFGYQLNSDDAVITSEGILLRIAQITNMPAAFNEGNDITLYDLGLKLIDHSVYQAGYSNEDITLNASAYGESIEVDRVEMRSGGLFAADADIKLAPGIEYNESDYIPCRDLKLINTGSLESGEIYDGSADSFEFNLLGYDVTGENLTFNGQAIVFGNAELTFPHGLIPPKVDLNGLSINGSGIVSNGASEETLRYSKDGWKYYLDGVSLTNQGIESDARLRLARRLGGRELLFENFIINSNGEYSTGEASIGSIVRIGGWKTLLQGIEISDETLTASSGTVSLHPSMGDVELEFPDIELSSYGGFVSSGTGDSLREFLSENGFPVSANGYTLSNNGIEITGDVHFPSALGENSHATYNADDPAMLYYNGVIETNISSEEVVYKVAGWDVSATNYYFDEKGLTIQNSEIKIPNTDVYIELPEMEFYSDGSFKAAGRSFGNVDLPFFGGRFTMDNFSFNEQGLTTAAFIELPPVLDSYQIYFDELTVNSDGTVTTNTAIPEFGFKMKKADLDFRFRNIRFQEGSLAIGEGIITLPEAMENKQVRISNFSIANDGSFDLGGIGFDPFEMWGYTFYLDSIGISNNDISFEGGVKFPEGLPAGLANKRLSISDFTYDISSNEVTSFDVSLDGEFTFNLTEQIDVEISNIGIKKKESDYYIYVNQGSLLFPDSLGMQAVSVTGVSVNPVTLEFDFESVAMVGEIYHSAFGLDFHLASLGLGKDDGDYLLTFTGDIGFPNTQEIPELLRGQNIDIDAFEIKHDATIGNVKGSLGLGGKVFDIMTLKEGSDSEGNVIPAGIAFDKTGDNLVLGLTGALELSGQNLPSGIRGKTLLISSFSIDTDDWSVTEFNASAQDLSFDLFGLVNFRDTDITAAMADGGSFKFGIAGDIYLPDALPEYIRKDPIHISEFTIDSNGEISAFHASKEFLGDNDIFGLITARDTHFEAEYDNIGDRIVFNIDGTQIILGDNFPEGIRGTTTTIETFSFDSLGNIETVAVDTAIPNGNLFGTLPISDAGLKLTKNGGTDVLIDIYGSLGMPAGTPSGLEDVTIDITRLAFTSSGTVEEVSIGASEISASILGVLNLQDGSVAVSKDINSGLLFTLTGDLSLSSSMPAPFSTTTFRLDPIAVSTSRGLVDFKAGIVGSVTFDLFAGITGTFNSLDISDSGIELSGSLSTPSGMPVVGDKTIVLETFEMDWSGNITTIEAGIEQLQTTVAGFTLDVQNLIVHKDHISMDKAELTLPSSLNGMKAGIKNATITYNGKFEGEFIAPNMDFDIVGFKLSLVSPSLDVDNQKIMFAQANIKTPSLVGGASISLNNLSISPSGIQLGGGGFDLPSFKIANGLEFALRVNFALDGSSYFIEGNGKIGVPNMGNFEVLASFTNKSSTYPWGLERAYFSFETAGIGLPLGATGLYMNGIRGGIAFGPPKEVPSVVRPYFRNGTRIQAGFSVRTGGVSVVQGRVDAWVDITNWYFAMNGEVSVLEGYFKAETTAALTGNMFYGRVAFQLVYVKGQAELWIWKDGSRVKIAGQGEVQFGLKKGAIFNKKILWKRVRIPSSDMWLGGLGAKFGQFTNGKSGFVGYYSFKYVGKIGLFASSSGSFSIGNMNGYRLSIPGAAAYSMSASRSLSLLENDSGTGNLNIGSVSLAGLYREGEMPQVRYLDNNTMVSTAADTYMFSVPGSRSTDNLQTDSRMSFSSSVLNPTASKSLSVSETLEIQPVERIIFVIGYIEGAPSITAVSPSGVNYSSELGNAELYDIENGSVLVVMEPEPGSWTVNVDGIPEGQEYTIDVMGKTRSPQLTELTPEYQGEQTGSGYTVSGNAEWYGSEQATVSVSLLPKSGQTLGISAGETVLNEQGTFSIELDIEDLPDGTYAVQFTLDDGESVPLIAEAAGTLVIKNTEPLAAVQNLVVSRHDDTSMKVTFSANESARTNGYLVYSTVGENTEERNIGNITQMVIPRAVEGQSYEVWVTAYDSDMNEGVESNHVTYAHQLETEIINTPELNGSGGSTLPSELNLEIGGSAELEIQCGTSGYTETGTAYDVAAIDVLEAPIWLSIIPDAQQYVLNGSEGYISIGGFEYESENGDISEPSPGDYEIRIALRNKGNNELVDEYSFTLHVMHPAPVINQVMQNEWHTLDEQEIVILGRNFTEGTSFYINEQELEVDTIQPQEVTLTVPSGLPGGENSIRAIGPDGTEVVSTVNIIVPGYTLDVYKQVGREPAGIEDTFYFAVSGYDRFDSDVTLTVSDLPNGWGAQVTPTIVDGQTGTLQITSASDSEAGEYPVQVTSGEGHVMDFVMNVTEDRVDPELRLVYPQAVIAGKEFAIYGNCFGIDTGSVNLEGTALSVTSWEDDRIVALTSVDMQSGTLTVETADGDLIGEIELVIKDSGFIINPEYSSLNVQPGDKIDMMLALKGAAQPVELNASLLDVIGNTVSDIALDKNTVTPNDITYAHVAIPETIENGSYTLHIAGESETFSASVDVPVTVGDAFVITNITMPDGMIDAVYSVLINTENNVGYVRFSLEDGEMPLGLSLSNTGEITGKPSEYGEYEFSVKAVDEFGHIAIKEFAVTVLENVWAMAGKDEGSSRFIAAAGPAKPALSWQQNISGTEDGEPRIIAGSGRVFSYGIDGIHAYEHNNGHEIWQYETAIENAFYVNSKLYALQMDGGFICLDAGYGHELWSRAGIEATALKNGELYLWQTSDEGLQLVKIPVNAGEDVPEGYVSGIVSNTELPYADVIVYRSGLYTYNEQTLYVLNENNDAATWVEAVSVEAPISSIASLGDTLCILTEEGALHRYNYDTDAQNLSKTDETATGIESGTILLSTTLYGAYSEHGLALYDSETKNSRIRRNTAVKDALLSKEKLYVTTETAVSTVNIYSGGNMWSRYAANGQYTQSIVSNGKLFTLESDTTGAIELSVYEGAANESGPDVNIVYSPSEPDGTNGFYISEAGVSLSVNDDETYVKEIMWRIDSPVFHLYNGPTVMEEGLHSIVAYAVDSDGVRSMDAVTSYNADLNDPVTEIEIEAPTAEGIDRMWYDHTPVFSLSASDSYSGVAYTEYRLNGRKWQKYSIPVTVEKEGINNLEYRSVDIAGRTEETQSLEIAIDLSVPTAEHTVRTEPGLGIVHIYAEDTGSGIDHIFYALDETTESGIIEGSYTEYLKPIVITKPGEYRVRYKSIDKAAFESIEGIVSFDIVDYEVDNLILELEYGQHSPGREIIKGIEPGDKIFSTSQGRHNKFDSVPEGLSEGFYFMTHSRDVRMPYDGEGLFAQFITGVDIEMYAMVDPSTQQGLNGWTLIESAHPIENDHYYKNGVDVYVRSFIKGDKIELPLASGWKVRPSLYVAVPVNTKNILITEPSRTVSPGQLIDISAEVLRGDINETGISVQIEDLEEETLTTAIFDSSVTAQFTLPSAQRMAEEFNKDSIKVTVTIENPAVKAVKELMVINQQGLFIDGPAPGSQIITGSTFAPDFRLIRPDGSEETDPEILAEITWQGTYDPESNEEDAWTDLAIVNNEETGSMITAPAVAGPWYLKAVYGTRSEIVRLNIVTEQTNQTVSFGNDAEGDYTLGAVLYDDEGNESVTASGIVQGFSRDHYGNIVTFETLEFEDGYRSFSRTHRGWPVPNIAINDMIKGKGAYNGWSRDNRAYLHNWWTTANKSVHPTMEEHSAILFESDSEYRIRVNNGRYKIVVETGPAQAFFGRPAIVVNGSRYSVRPNVFHQTQMQLETEVTVEDGWIVITGEDQPSISNISIELLDDTDPSVTTSVQYLPGLIVTRIHWPPGLDLTRNRHYRKPEQWGGEHR